MAMPEPKLLMFDYDGVIADSLEVFHPCLAAVCRRRGVTAVDAREAFLSLFDGNMFDGLLAAGCAAEDLPALTAELRQALAAEAGRVRLFAGMGAALGDLARVHRVVVITSSPAEPVRRKLAVEGVAPLPVLGAEQGLGKVDKIRRTLAEPPGLPAWYIGDTTGDIVEGRCAGAHTIGVAWGWHGRARLTAAAPDRIVDTPMELLRWAMDSPSPATPAAER